MNKNFYNNKKRKTKLPPRKVNASKIKAGRQPSMFRPYSSIPEGHYTVPNINLPRRRKTKMSVYFIRFAVYIFFIAVMFLIISLLMLFNLNKTVKDHEITYIFNYGEAQDSAKKTVPFEIGHYNNLQYVPVNDIFDHFDFITSGEKNEYSFTNSETDEYIKIISNTNVCYVNDVKIYLDYPIFEYGDELYLPLNFVDNCFDNLLFEIEGDKVTITKDTDILSFNVHKALKTQNIDEDSAWVNKSSEDELGVGSIPVGDDVSLETAYAEYIDPKNREEYLTLINKTNPIVPQDYVPPDLTDIADTRPDRGLRKMRLCAAKALEAFLAEAREEGCKEITVTSAYRSYKEQQETFNYYLEINKQTYGAANAESITSKTVQYPGMSEHQSGLAVDMHSLSAADVSFADTYEAAWLAENAHRFGYILRYPADKTEITGISFEPWHFRFVGKYHATRIYEQNLCLEEYIEQLNDSSN